MDWKLLLASFVALVLNVSAQKGGMCRYNNISYKEGSRFANINLAGCYCTCKSVNGQLRVDCDTTQCKPKTCLYNGRTYQVNEKFRSRDNCGDCTCKENSKVECNLNNQCKTTPRPAPICDASMTGTLGTLRMSGAVWESPDKCKKYTCVNGKVQAQDQICKCVYNGNNFALGQTFNVECNTCVCNQNGQVTCSNNHCGCTFNNQKLQPGQSVPAPDGCNTCTCGTNRQMSCTNQPCECRRNGQVYRINQEFPAGDGCNNCKCNTNGMVTCSQNKCS
jgi:hypothetical protein